MEINKSNIKEILSNYNEDELMRELAERKIRTLSRERYGPPLKPDSLFYRFPSRGPQPVRDKIEKEQIKRLNTVEIIERVKEIRKGKYGIDDRKDLFKISDRKILDNADCVVCIISSENMLDKGNNTHELKVRSFGKALGLCETEPFRDQPCIVGKMGTGFLVRKNIVATACHCIMMGKHISKLEFFFGFKMLDGKNTNIINNNEIYKGKKIIDKIFTPKGPDWALIELDREVENHNIAKLRKTGKISYKQKVYIIGYPYGLPIKFSDGSWVTNNDNLDYFSANIDAYCGNSGSPVFNSDNHMVEGILIRGLEDFETSPEGCKWSKVYRDDKPNGEECMRIIKIKKLKEIQL